MFFTVRAPYSCKCSINPSEQQNSFARFYILRQNREFSAKILCLFKRYCHICKELAVMPFKMLIKPEITVL